jgi:methylmalonyl-CoA mutase
VVGGVIPEQDFAPLRAAGADATVPPGAVLTEAAHNLVEQLNRRLGFTRRAPA